MESICSKAFELASCFMLVALCEEAVEKLSSMNHPKGDCPLCLFPLLDEDAGNNSLPFMKLMSCFHCFHCDCIIRWWNWIQMQSENESSSSSSSAVRSKPDQQDENFIRRRAATQNYMEVDDFVEASSCLLQPLEDFFNNVFVMVLMCMAEAEAIAAQISKTGNPPPPPPPPMAEEEVIAEVEAAQAVYGDDCLVIETYPPHLHVHLKPRTAEVSSEQFVEATIGMQAGPKYPEEPPVIRIIDSKGLDEQRQKHLMESICSKAFELASCLMLVALCEEAVEKLSSMNHPEGDCPLCLFPLLDEDAGNNSLPFMKLMSCFHCFHCDCIIRWWNWIQMQSENESSSSSSSTVKSKPDQRGIRKMMEGSRGKCPVCRKIFLAKDIEHVLDLVGTSGNLDCTGTEIDRGFLQSEEEIIRKEKFDAILKIQQENNGLIEPKKNEVLLPGMFLPQPVGLPSTESEGVSSASQSKDRAAKSDANPESSSNRRRSRKPNNYHRKQRTPNTNKQERQWIRKDNVSDN
ncbi:E3 ubiquitin-protein ligase RNF25 [Salvia hispanica]|uniref:E3 ubiquitin-protein ligase RNF25 n=1 Tax=Salvia hispanica TaxID=49212 RepID=UPI00200928DD|nr:E3 ubiquitin-protein ligase RNF25 [Salvia hispanica]